MPVRREPTALELGLTPRLRSWAARHGVELRGIRDFRSDEIKLPKRGIVTIVARKVFEAQRLTRHTTRQFRIRSGIFMRLRSRFALWRAIQWVARAHVK